MGAEFAGGAGGGGAWTAAAGPHHRASFSAENAGQPVTGGGLKIARAAQTGLPPGPRAESSKAVGGRAGGPPAE